MKPRTGWASIAAVSGAAFTPTLPSLDRFTCLCPVLKAEGASVFAGSINASEALQVRVTKLASDNTIVRIIRLVEEAQEAKAPTARFIERFAAAYTPVAVGVATLVAVAPPVFLGADWSIWIYYGLALLLVACPCALVLSTPAAIAETG